MDVTQFLPIEANEELKQERDGDYMQNGLLYCGTCHTPRQKKIRLPIGGKQEHTVWVLCQCEVKKQEQERAHQEYEEQMRRIDQMRAASMMPGKFRTVTFGNYEVRKENARAFKISQKYVENFRQMEEKNQGLLFYGPVGTGKSHTAACIANALMEKEISVIMTSFVKILQDIQTEKRDESSYLATLDAARLLIIDDLGAERDTDYALEKVYNVIDSRVRVNKPMILTTNLKVGEMMETQDIRYKRIYDRIFEVCYPVEVNGPSFRMRQAAERQEAMKRLFE